jgi:hypothetical protein
MALKEKLLIVWILCSMLAAFLASHAMAIIVAGLENSCALALVAAIALKVAVAFFSCGNS